ELHGWTQPAGLPPAQLALRRAVPAAGHGQGSADNFRFAWANSFVPQSQSQTVERSIKVVHKPHKNHDAENSAPDLYRRDCSNAERRVERCEKTSLRL